MASSKEFDIVLLGATGYTGKLTAEYLASSGPSTLKWAIAGRSQSKLDALKGNLKSASTPAVITITELSVPEVSKLAKRTRILLNTIGPYHKFSTPIVQACAETGTHYFDVTGETPWVKEIIEKFDDTAKKNKAILIPEIGIESAPSDLLAYSAVKIIRDVWDCGVMDMVAAVHELKSSGASGGTMATGIGLSEHYGMKTLREATNPFCLSPMAKRDHRHTKYPTPTTYRKTGLQKFTGVWDFPLLGTLGPSITAAPNEAIVHRSAGKYPYFYGFNFNYSENMSVSSALVGYLVSAAITALLFVLAIPPLRMIFKALAFKPGDGPSMESTKGNRYELRGVAMAEQLSKVPRKAFANFTFEGGIYHLTAILIAEGALSLLADQDKVVKVHGYGFLTPSTLGDDYIARLDKAGAKVNARQIGDVGSK